MCLFYNFLLTAIPYSVFPSKRSFSPNDLAPAAVPRKHFKVEGFFMFKKYAVALVVLAGLSFVTSYSYAQSALLDLPRDSQHSVVTQRIGITDIPINYSRPLVKEIG